MNFRLSRLLLAIAAIAGLGAGICGSASAEPAGPPNAPAKAADSKEENLLPVLPPEQFFGPAAMGYAAAKGCPYVCNHLFCYCGCDITDKHKSLLDCFTGTHGADCHICQEEAMVALRMNRNDDSLSAIQKAIDEAYSNKYPFKEESPALKQYKALRKWQPSVGGQTSGAKSTSGSEAGETCCPRK